jgi:hypothetical protein
MNSCLEYIYLFIYVSIALLRLVVLIIYLNKIQMVLKAYQWTHNIFEEN